MRGKGLLVNLGVLAGSAAFLFIVLELLARLVLPKPPTVQVDGVSAPPASDGLREIRWSRGVGGPSLHRVTESGLRMNPNVYVTIMSQMLSGQDAVVRTNSLGYRGEELGPKSDQELRLLFLGDSITIADYAPETETFPALAASDLRKMNLTGKTIRAINAGVGSIDLRSEFMILMETGLSTKPDIIVEGLYLNDADPSFTLTATTVPPSIRWSRLLTYIMSRTDRLKTIGNYRQREESRDPELRRFVASHPVSSTDDWRTSQEGFNREIVNAFGDWGYAWTGEAWTTMEQTLELMRQVARDHDIELYVVLLPVRQQVQAKILRDEPQQKFEAIMKRLGLPHLNLLPPMREAFARDGVDIFYDHCHYRPAGNALVGRLIAEMIARESKKIRLSGGAAPASPAPSPTPATVPRLGQPTGLGVLPSGELLVTDSNLGLVARGGADGVWHLFGAPQYKQPGGIAVDAKGVVHVADTWNNRIVRLTADGETVGTLQPPPNGFASPRGVAVTPQGTLLVLDSGHSQLVHYQPHGEVLRFWGIPGSGDTALQSPTGVAASDHEVFVADYGNARIQVFGLDGTALRRFPIDAWRSGDQRWAPGLAYRAERLYICDPADNAVLIFSTAGESRGRLTSADLHEPISVAVAADGRIYAGNAGTGTIAVLSDTTPR